MKIKCALFGCALLLTACGQSEQSMELETPVALSSEVASVVADATLDRRVLEVDGKKFTIVVPDGYTVADTDLPEVLIAMTSGSTDEDFVQVSWSAIDDGDLASYVANPIWSIQTEGVAPFPKVSDVCCYITGDALCAGVSMRNYVNFSQYKYSYPDIVLPEVNYVFDIEGPKTLVLRISYNAPYLTELIDTVALLEENADAVVDFGETYTNADTYDTMIEELALDFVEHFVYGDYVNR